MEEFNGEKITNPAHCIIYKNIYNKLSDIHSRRIEFHDQSKSLYKEAFNKYNSFIQKEDL